MTEKKDRRLRVKQVAERLQVSPDVIYRLAKAGHFKACKIGGTLFIYESSINGYVKRQTNLYTIENGYFEQK